MKGYHVLCIDGPAHGFAYATLIEPDPIIAVAPIAGRWARVLVGERPWDGQVHYARTVPENPPRPIDADRNDEVVYYAQVTDEEMTA